MSFGRNKNMVRRAYRPNGSHHRTMRRRKLDHPLAPHRAAGTVLSLFVGVLKLFVRRRRRRF